MNDITPKEASEILSSYTDLGYGIVIEGDDVSKIVQALSLARKTLASGGDLISRSALKEAISSSIAEATEAGMVVDADYLWELLNYAIDNAPTVPQVTVFTETADEKAVADLKAELQSVIEPRPQGECENCDFRKFSEKFVDGFVELMNKNGIASVEQLSKILKGGAE